MDYSKVKYVKPSVDGIGETTGKVYFKKGKVYEIQGDFLELDKGLFCVINEFKRKSFILIPNCAHLDDAPWIPCTKDGTPL